MTENSITVQVALRIRPLVESETARGCQNSLDLISNEAQVVIKGTEKAFTYNYVFGPEDSQSVFYDKAVKDMVKNVFKGYNVTILAYGQTGSGKTYSMGTSFDGKDVNDNSTGIIPRAICDIFTAIEQKTNCDFKVTVSFMELYKEQLYDLLAPVRSTVDIREEGKVIKIPGLTEVPVANFQETVKCLTQGSMGRATGATAMNAQSSRSHAIFTLTVQQQEKNNVESATSAKFHLVDLAGSERPKKTQATGERFKEGVNINRGLLALGNVISALGDEQQRGFISYRDSKLTRLLQDSLGGNSLTLMIACASPADYNLEETLSTLRYADRARNIKNKPIVNVDAKVAEIAKLKHEVQQLKLELDSKNGNGFNYHELLKLKEENEILSAKNRKLNQALNGMFNENTNLVERALLAETSRDRMKIKLCELQAQYGNAVESLNQTLDPNTCPASFYEQLQTLKELKLKIQDLQADQQRAEEEILNHEISNNNRSEAGGNDVEYDEKSHSTHHKDLDEHHEAYTFQQAALSKELQELNKALALKEELATQLKLNANQISNINNEFVENMKDLEHQVTVLQQEKDELLQALKTAQSNTTCNLGDQRRKKLQELEQKISTLNRKITEQSKVIKMKEKSEEKISALFNEIQNMKSNKVRLIRQMRAENERFRLWKLQKERELVKLRDQDRRHQFQLNRMERLHSKQQNVLRRKVEESAAINKRLKDALALQKSAQERRAQHGNSAVKIQQWVEQELEVLVSTLVAEKTIEQLLEDRSLLSQQLKQLQCNLEDESLRSKDKEEIEEEIKQLNEDISLRNTQISDLQQKLIDADKENKAKHRWETVQSMNDAKCALKYLFELLADLKTLKDFKFEEIQISHNKALETLQKYEQQLKQLAQEHQQEVIILEKEHQDKIFVLLHQLQRSSNGELVDSDVTERLKIQEYELQKIENLRNEVETKQAEIELLKKQLDKPKRGRKTNIFQKEDLITDYNSESEEDVDGSDDPNDPDWQKTPLFKRLSKLKKKRQPSLEDNSVLDVEKENKKVNEKGIKRSSDGEPMCSCTGKCVRCACKKLGELCTSLCKCSVNMCTNRDQTNTHERVLFCDEETTEDDDSFKRPRPLSENAELSTPQPKKMKTRYFQGN